MPVLPGAWAGLWGCPSCFLNRGHVSLVERVPVPVSSCMFHIRFSLVMFVVPALCTCSSWAAAIWVAGLAPSPACFQSMQFLIWWSLGFASGGMKTHLSLIAAVLGVLGHSAPLACPLLGPVTHRTRNDPCSELGLPECHCFFSLGVSGLFRGCCGVSWVSLSMAKLCSCKYSPETPLFLRASPSTLSSSPHLVTLFHYT